MLVFIFALPKQNFKMTPMTFTLGAMPMIMEHDQKDSEDVIKVINQLTLN